MQHIPIEKRIIFALDVNTKEEVEKWLNRLGSYIKFYKVGLELFVSLGFEVVDMISDRGFEVMLDLKLYDIPKTVERTVKQIRKRRVSFLTVHGNYDILRAAVDGAGDSNLKILGVTVLTSFDEKDLKELGYNVAVEELVLNRARLTYRAGCAGVVASAHEAKLIKSKIPDLTIVTPGIRVEVSKKQDQKRVMTPPKAIEMGSDYLVIGRAIRDSDEPEVVTEKIISEIKYSLKK